MKQLSFFFCATIPDRREDLYNTGAQIDRYCMDNLNTTIRRELCRLKQCRSRTERLSTAFPHSLFRAHIHPNMNFHIVASRYNSKIITSAPHTQRHIKAEIPHLGQMDAKGWTERDRGVSPLPLPPLFCVFACLYSLVFFYFTLLSFPSPSFACA